MTARKLLVLASVAACLGFGLLMGATTARAEVLVPCCEGGYKPERLCDSDSDCFGACVGGFRDGRPCEHGVANCPSACVGGFDDGHKCESDSDCRGICQGGPRSGQPCSSVALPRCPGGGVCVNTGTCSNSGQCVTGTCTGLCETKRPVTSPSAPTRWFGAFGGRGAAEGSAIRACP
jgi:hypothetical protein